MADYLKCIFCMLQHVVVVQYTKQCCNGHFLILKTILVFPNIVPLISKSGQLPVSNG